MPLIICQCRIGPSPPTRHIPAQSTPATRDVCLARGQHEGRALCTPSRRLLTACQAQPHTDATEQSVDDTPDRPRGLQRNAVVGVLGGGQLGKMLGLEAAKMGLKLVVLDPTPDCPASGVAHQTVGSFRNRDDIRRFVEEQQVDVLTMEIEHIDVDTLDYVVLHQGVDVQPRPSTLRIIQDKLEQRKFFQRHRIPTGSFLAVEFGEDLREAAEVFGFPFMLKATRLAYDGRGNFVVRSEADMASGVAKLGGFEAGLYAEAWVPFVKELAVMVARSRYGDLRPFPVAETKHRDSILMTTEVPANVSYHVLEAARKLALDAVSLLDGAGVFGVEMFLLEGGQILLNEVAPRPHNSGHYTIEATSISQFEQHLRAILGWPLADVLPLAGASIMLNILGEADGEEGASQADAIMEHAQEIPEASVHWYGKHNVRKSRKMGHITITGPDRNVCRERLASVSPEAAISILDDRETSDEESTAPGSWNSWPPGTSVTEEHDLDFFGAEAKRRLGSDRRDRNTAPSSTSSTPQQAGPKGMPENFDGHLRLPSGRTYRWSIDDEDWEEESDGEEDSVSRTASSSQGAGRPAAQVGIIMGSDSDLSTMEAAVEVLRHFQVPLEVTVVSAHRTPERLINYGRGAHHRGIKVIIAGAGGAAHLPGMVASLTPLPVVGVPCIPPGQPLDGLDALLSIVQASTGTTVLAECERQRERAPASRVMPRGVPVATVAIGNAANAGLLAVRILATSNSQLQAEMMNYQAEMKEAVLRKAKKVEDRFECHVNSS